MTNLSIRIVGHHLPGRDCGEFQDIHVAVQRGRDPEGEVPGDAPEAVWEFTVERVESPARDFKGPHVQGRKGERFLYLTWGEHPPGKEFTMFRRAKLFLDDIPDEVAAGGTAVLELGLTDSHGMPLCAALRPPRFTWRKG
ncbi:DUF5990 family protein [Streptomyces sp. T-3]|nr:DUF5990 family protein [Streptomyces sp. T-3]